MLRSVLGVRALPRAFGRQLAAKPLLASQRGASRHMASYLRHVNVQNIKTYWPQIAAATGAVVVIYGMSVLVFDVTSTLVNLSFEQVFYAGFLSGTVVCLAIGGTGLYLYRAATLSPNQVFKAAMAKLQKSEIVRAKLGPHIRAGSLKAYVTVPGHLALPKGSMAPSIVAPHTQMLFQVVGEWGEGMATVEALKHRGVLKFNVVALDILGSGASSTPAPGRPAAAGRPGELLLVAGTEDNLHVVGTLRGFLQAERAAYIPQDKAASDEEWIKQQEDLPAEAEPEEAGEGQASHTEPQAQEKKMQ